MNMKSTTKHKLTETAIQHTVQQRIFIFFTDSISQPSEVKEVTATLPPCFATLISCFIA
jgi:hypothetical protein